MERKRTRLQRVSSIDLLEHRVIYLDGEINDELARKVIDNLLRLDLQGKKDITMYINSSGGSVSSGLAIYDVMNLVKSDVSTICIGKCASMASILLINGAKGKRYILPNAEVMIHEVSAGTFGKVTEMQMKLDHTKSLNNKLWKIIEDKTNRSFQQIKKDATNKDAWMSSRLALKYGFVDKIL